VWAHVLTLLVAERRAHPPEGAADHAAWTLIWAGLKHFGAPVDINGDVDETRRERAAAALRGGKKDARVQAAVRYVEAMRTGARLAGESFAGFGDMSRVACAWWRRPTTEAPELERMLANFVEPKKQGRLQSGKSTRAQIAAWLTGGGESDQKIAARIGRAKRI
jgi:hypothetical protein